MKKIVFILACFIGFSTFAQNIPADSLEHYRRTAHGMLIDGDTTGAVELYKELALSGDVMSGYQLHDFYSRGIGVRKDLSEATKWGAIAQQNLTEARRAQTVLRSNELYSRKDLTLQDALNESGRLIEQGGREKNTAIAVGVGGGSVGATLVTVGMTQQSTAVTVIGGVIAGGCGLAAFILDIVGNKHIKQGGEIMRRVKITGDGISVSF